MNSDSKRIFGMNAPRATSPQSGFPKIAAIGYAKKTSVIRRNIFSTFAYEPKITRYHRTTAAIGTEIYLLTPNNSVAAPMPTNSLIVTPAVCDDDDRDREQRPGDAEPFADQIEQAAPGRRPQPRTHLLHDRKRKRQHDHHPDHVVAVLRPGRTVSRDPARVVARRRRDQARARGSAATSRFPSGRQPQAAKVDASSAYSLSAAPPGARAAQPARPAASISSIGSRPSTPASRLLHENTLSVRSQLDDGKSCAMAALIVIAPINFPSDSTTGIAASCPPTIRCAASTCRLERVQCSDVGVHHFLKLFVRPRRQAGPGVSPRRVSFGSCSSSTKNQRNKISFLRASPANLFARGLRDVCFALKRSCCLSSRRRPCFRGNGAVRRCGRCCSFGYPCQQPSHHLERESVR